MELSNCASPTWLKFRGHTHTLNFANMSFSALALVALVAATPLHDAVQQNNVTQLTAVIEAGAAFDTLDDNALTALHLSTYLGHREATKGLLARGAPLETRSDHDGMTAVLWAAGQGHADVLGDLLDAGANPHAVDDHGRTALHYSASRGHHDAVRLLLKSGVAVDSTSDRRVTALQLAAAEGHVEIVKALCDAGAALDAQADEAKMSALHGASLMGHTAVIQVLLGAGAAATALDSSARTPLHHAAQRGHAAAVEALLNASSAAAILEKHDLQGQTARRLAERAGHRAVTRLLRAHGAEPTGPIGRLGHVIQKWWGSVVRRATPTGRFTIQQPKMK